MSELSADFPTDVDVLLVVTDMDGTLLDDTGEVPDDFWPLLAEMRTRGITFSPASGRQYATLRRTFSHLGDHPDGEAGPDSLADMVFIAENGGYVVRDGAEISSLPLDLDLARRVVEHVRAVEGLDLGVVWCAPERAYVERTDRAFLDHVDPYYASLAEVDDLLAVDDVPVKIAVWTSGDPHDTAPALADWSTEHGGPLRVVVSGHSWVDVQSAETDKGAALRSLQDSLGVTPAQTVVLGDNFNDVEMLDAAELSFAMAGAPDGVAERARYRAPSHRDHGVVTVLRRLLDVS